jgi:hypothetical protein
MGAWMSMGLTHSERKITEVMLSVVAPMDESAGSSTTQSIIEDYII